ncbi:MAG: PTS system mannose/fructose/N-acetylgalactosamine-transporter subunit IIB [Myxococcaceae bacterium]
MISFVRVDNRLIHGQVVEAWLPYLKVGRVVVADDEAAMSDLVRAAMGLAVQSAIEVKIQPLAEVDFASLHADPVKTLVLFRDVEQMMAARKRGLPPARVNLGNVHHRQGRNAVTPSVFLSQGELDQLKMLSESGVEVEARAVPNERAVSLPELQERFGKGA